MPSSRFLRCANCILVYTFSDCILVYALSTQAPTPAVAQNTMASARGVAEALSAPKERGGPAPSGVAPHEMTDTQLMQLQLRRRRTGHALSDKAREDRMKRRWHDDRVKLAAMYYNKGLALAASDRHRDAILCYNAALENDALHPGIPPNASLIAVSTTIVNRCIDDDSFVKH